MSPAFDELKKEAVGLYVRPWEDSVGHVAGVVSLQRGAYPRHPLPATGQTAAIGFVNAALPRCRVTMDNGVDDHIRHNLADGAGQLYAGKADAVLQTATDLGAIGSCRWSTGKPFRRSPWIGRHHRPSVHALRRRILSMMAISISLADLIGEEHRACRDAGAASHQTFLHKQAVDGVYVVLRVENWTLTVPVGVRCRPVCLEGEGSGCHQTTKCGRKSW